MRKLYSIYFVIVNGAEVARGTLLSIAIGEAIRLGARRIESGHGDIWECKPGLKYNDPIVWSRL